ncbi:hypothetical protein ACFCW2_06980 [Qipengyuania sp. DSG2-2]|uniref:hypothetical protein n=1 Tax=Qipengyuania sp. DGS2-2 TaxID=3349631 RepID=UPI0036D3AF7C
METSFADNFGWIEIVFSGAVALGFGFYQLWSVNREIAKDKEKAAAKEAAEQQHAAD